MIGLVYHELFVAHGGPWHPENGGRLEAVVRHLRGAGWWDRFQPLEFGPATSEELMWLHDEDYLEFLQSVCRRGGGLVSPDTFSTAETFDAATLAAGGCMAAARAALQHGPPRTLCLVRPPGHHALSDRPMGFCFLNNAALAAEAALREGLQRVAIVDFDAHHGNGTQEAFYHRRDVLYVSLHEHGLFPLTGSLDEVGVEEGAGFTINLPMIREAGDTQYRRAFTDVAIPALDAYRPELLILSAGYDAHHTDRLAHLNLTIAAFHAITQALVDAAERHCQGRIMVVLEGGYDVDWLPLGVESSLRALSGEGPLDVQDVPREVHPQMLQRVTEALDTVIGTHRQRLGLG